LPETSESGSLGGYIYNDDEDDDADDELDNEHSDFESCEELEGANQRAAREISDLSISGISAVQHDETLPHEDASDDYVEIVKNLSDSEQSSDDDVSEPLKLRKFDYTLVLECMCAGSKRKQINVWLPETLVFVNNVPLCWYFTRKQVIMATWLCLLGSCNAGLYHLETKLRAQEVNDKPAGQKV